MPNRITPKPPTITVCGESMTPLASTWYPADSDGATVTYPASSSTPNDMPAITARPLEFEMDLPGDDWHVLVEFVFAFSESYTPVQEPLVVSCQPAGEGCTVLDSPEDEFHFVVQVPEGATFARLDVVHVGDNVQQVSDAYYPFKLVAGDLELQPEPHGEVPSYSLDATFAELLPPSYEEAYRVFLMMASEEGATYQWSQLLPEGTTLSATTAMRDLVGPNGSPAHLELPYSEFSAELDDQLIALLGPDSEVYFGFSSIYGEDSRIDETILQAVDPQTNELTARFASTTGENWLYRGPASYLHKIAGDRGVGHLPVHMWNADGSVAIAAPLYGDSLLISGPAGLGEKLTALGMDFAPITDPHQPVPLAEEHGGEVGEDD